MAKKLRNTSTQTFPARKLEKVKFTFQQAFSHHQKGELAQAKILYENLLKIQPEHFDGLHFLGVIAYQTNQYHVAVELISKAITVNPKQAAPYSNIGMAFQSLNLFDDALTSYNRAIALKPDYAEAYYNRGNVLKALDRLEEALASYNQAIALAPVYFQAYLNCGNTLIQLDRLKDAVACYDKAITLNPNYFQAYFNRGKALAALKRSQEALADYDKGISFKPDHAEAYRSRGDILTSLKRPDQALIDYDKALSLQPDFVDAQYNRATTLLNLQRFDEAQISYEKVLELQPENQNAQYALAALTRKNVPSSSPRAYVAKIFDMHAETFDDHLVGDLEYQTPTILAAQFSPYAEEGRRYDMLDLGCGTGLSGKAFRGYAQHLVGIDLSAGMLEKAKQSALYDALICTDIIEYLQTVRESTDLIVCADVLVYIGDLNDLFRSVTQNLRNGGWFSFSVEDTDTDVDSYELKPSQRYGHSMHYITSMAKSSGLIIEEALSTKLRKEREKYISGHAFLLRKPRA